MNLKETVNSLMNKHYLVRAAKLEMIDSSSRETMGGLDWLVVTVLMAAGVLSAFSPWSFFIGGRFTPLAQWTGFGKLHSAVGGDYGLFLRLAHRQTDDLTSGLKAKSSLHGSAILCTPQGEKVEYRLEGMVRDAWLQTEGQSTKLVLTTGHESEAGKLNLHGVWRQGNLVVNEVQVGGMEPSGLGATSGKPSPASPRTAARARPGKHRSPSNPGGRPAVTVSYGTLSGFNDFCQAEIARSSERRLISQSSPN